MVDTFFKQVGNNIQRILETQGKTQQYLADKISVSQQVISKIISGSKAINVMEITKIASALGVSTDCLLVDEKTQPVIHSFSFMGQVKSEKTQEKIAFLQTVIDEILMLEEYADE